MAAKQKGATTKRGGTSVKRAQAAGRKLAAPSKRPARPGRRTTLRVPARLEAEIARTAGELGISENEALVRLAEIGARAAARERDVRRVIDRRRAAVSGSRATGPDPLPSPQEMREAILADRD